MTMMKTNSPFGLEDMEALLCGPSSPTADAMHSLFFHTDQVESQEGSGTSLQGDTSPVSPLPSSSLSSSSSPPAFYSPPPSPPASLLHGEKAENESDLFSLPWLGPPGQLRRSQMVSDESKEDMFDMDWMAEKVDLSEFDLESLIGSCSPNEESANSADDLLASLGCPMEFDSHPVPAHSSHAPSSDSSVFLPSTPPTTVPTVSTEPSVTAVDVSESSTDEQEVSSPPTTVPEPEEELEIKSEPSSPEPSAPVSNSPSSPVYTLDLGSEVDVSASEVAPVFTAVVPQVPRLVFSLSPTRIVLLLAPKNEVGITTTTVSTSSEVIPQSPPASSPAAPPQRSSRRRPYPEPKYKASPLSPSATTVEVKSPRSASDDEKVFVKAPKDKKLKKMEQNKTAALRYRQKKRAEHDALGTEYAFLERKNMELQEKAESMAREIEYLKELMEEVRLARIKKGLGPDP